MNRTFKASAAVRFAFILGLTAAFVFSWWLRNDEASTLLFLFCGTGVIAIFFAWPRNTHLDEDGIWQRDRLGRKRLIRWDNVGSLAHLAADGKTIVGGGKVQIVHGTLHRDKQDFCELIEQRTGCHLSVGMWSGS